MTDADKHREQLRAGNLAAGHAARLRGYVRHWKLDPEYQAALHRYDDEVLERHFAAIDRLVPQDQFDDAEVIDGPAW